MTRPERELLIERIIGDGGFPKTHDAVDQYCDDLPSIFPGEIRQAEAEDAREVLHAELVEQGIAEEEK